MICSFNFLIFLAVCLNISTVINIKILTNSNQQTQSYKFTSHIAAFLSVALITEMLAWSLHTNIIWSKRSTDFKELSPCSVWYHLKHSCICMLVVSILRLFLLYSYSILKLFRGEFWSCSEGVVVFVSILYLLPGICIIIFF